MSTGDFFKILLLFSPLFSAITFGIVTVLACYNCYSKQELKTKRLLLIYYILIIIAGIGLLFEIYDPKIYLYLNSLHLICTMLLHVVFYNIVLRVCNTSKKKFPKWMYIVPIIIGFVLSIGTLLIPYDICYTIISSRGKVVPEGYSLFAFMSTKKYELSFIVSIYCSVLTFYKLRQYKLLSKTNPHKYPISDFSLIILAVMTTVLFLVAFLCVFKTWTSRIGIFLLTIQNVFLCYASLSRKNTMFGSEHFFAGNFKRSEILWKKRSYKKIAKPDKNEKDEALTKSKFEAYMLKCKPYTNPDLKITDLIVEFKTNRTYISSFINDTYKMNFNKYVNILRLKELNRLSKLESNKKKDISELISKAGFGSYRSYMRAKQNI